MLDRLGYFKFSTIFFFTLFHFLLSVGGGVTSVIIEALGGLLEGLHGNICFLLASQYRDQEESRL